MMPLRIMAASAAIFLCQTAPSVDADDPPPNFVIIFVDDLGYADVGCFGAKEIRTPNIDRLASEGVRLTSFYTAQPVCSASRAALLTGCYANRIGIHGALNAKANHGIADSETTLGELCKAKGYRTAVFGKWHLGHHPQFLPTRHGFDVYFGLPYSNDMWPHRPDLKPGSHPPLPLFDNDKTAIADVKAEHQAQLTQWYTQRAVQFIEENKDRPFLLYLPHTMVHVPLFASERFKGKSKAGLYGDVVEEIDWSVGEIGEALRRNGIERSTLVVFTSDNGPWLSYGNHGGSAGPLREGKGTVWEGGVRAPFAARWPGRIPAGTVSDEPVMTIDLFPTIARLIGAPLPRHPIDGKDIWPILSGEPNAKSPHKTLYFYYGEGELQAVRGGKWKLILPHKYRSMKGQAPGKDGKPGSYAQVDVRLELYDLEADIGESKDVSLQNVDVVNALLEEVETARRELGDKLTGRKGAGVRPAGQRMP